MKMPKVSRRDVLKGSAAVAVAAGTFAPSAKVLAQAPPPTAITPELIKAAQKEGRVVYYTSIDLPVAERIAKQFATTLPGHHAARRAHRRRARVPAHRAGIRQQDPRGRRRATRRTPRTSSSGSARASCCPSCRRTSPSTGPRTTAIRTASSRPSASGSAVIGYNTNMVKAAEAPKSFADLLDPKWAGKMVKAHPGYSGTIMTATSRSPASSAGSISRSSPSRRSCRCSRRPIRPRSSSSASAR